MGIRKRIGLTGALAGMLLGGLVLVSPAAEASGGSACGEAPSKVIPVPKSGDPRWYAPEACIDVNADTGVLTATMYAYFHLCPQYGTKCAAKNRTTKMPTKVVFYVWLNRDGKSTRHACDLTASIRSQIKKRRDHVEHKCSFTMKPKKHARYWSHGNISHDVAGDGKGAYWIRTGISAYHFT